MKRKKSDTLEFIPLTLLRGAYTKTLSLHSHADYSMSTYHFPELYDTF